MQRSGESLIAATCPVCKFRRYIKPDEPEQCCPDPAKPKATKRSTKETQPDKVEE